MTRFEILKFIHVLGAVLWVGAGAGLMLLTVRLRSADERDAIIAIGRQTESIAKGLFMPAALTTLAFGILMVATEPRFAFSDLWIVVGFAGLAASFVVGVILLEPADKRLTALLVDRSLDDPQVDRELRKVIQLNTLDLAILVTAIWAMVAKPMW